MMPDLGKYAAEVLSAYAVTISLTKRTPSSAGTNDGTGALPLIW